jgi:hypothetical protein
MMHKHVLAFILSDEAQTLLIVPPFDFAFSHNASLLTPVIAMAKKVERIQTQSVLGQSSP